MLVFRHEGNMEFEVCIFDSSHCDREYVEYLQEEGGGARYVEEISKKFGFKGMKEKEGDHIKFVVVTNGKRPIRKFHANGIEKPEHNIMSSCQALPNVKAAKDMPLSHPHFICTMKPYCLSKCFLRVPVSFARLNGLRNRKCMIETSDGHGHLVYMPVGPYLTFRQEAVRSERKCITSARRKNVQIGWNNRP
ncbi:hypothetical protein K7X08_030101 [Anisodus acutangulus]|uniref:Uncharacterized protein n=1 Tax=Anisodus acutangulus TaxID=402998 RepID=A0A9Q1LNL6_9SOLA|nr:hypothetical protein K7X08_030101 [Anisodus acutangulus]